MMTWSEVKAEIDTTQHEGSEFALIERREFWNSDEKVVFKTLSYLYGRKQYESVLAIATKLEALDYRFSPNIQRIFLYLLADLSLDLGNNANSIAIYDEILRSEQTDIAYANRALAKRTAGDQRGALKDYLKAIKLNPGNSIALRAIGEIFLRADRPDKAIGYLKRSLTHNPKYTEAASALGLAYFNKGEMVKSYEIFKKALTLAPDDKIAAKGIAKIENHFDL